MDYTPEFEQFWAVYPKKSGKLAAYRNWQKAIKSSRPEEIIAGAVRYAEHCKAKIKDAHYIKLAQGWLNDGRWEDEIEADQVQVVML